MVKSTPKTCAVFAVAGKKTSYNLYIWFSQRQVAVSQIPAGIDIIKETKCQL